MHPLNILTCLKKWIENIFLKLSKCFCYQVAVNQRVLVISKFCTKITTTNFCYPLVLSKSSTIICDKMPNVNCYNERCFSCNYMLPNIQWFGRYFIQKRHLSEWRYFFKDKKRTRWFRQLQNRSFIYMGYVCYTQYNVQKATTEAKLFDQLPKFLK